MPAAERSPRSGRADRRARPSGGRHPPSRAPRPGERPYPRSRSNDSPSHVPVSAGGSVKTPVAVQLLLPEMGGIAGLPPWRCRGAARGKWASAVVPHFWAPTIMKPSARRWEAGMAAADDGWRAAASGGRRATPARAARSPPRARRRRARRRRSGPAAPVHRAIREFSRRAQRHPPPDRSCGQRRLTADEFLASIAWAESVKRMTRRGGDTMPE